MASAARTARNEASPTASQTERIHLLLFVSEKKTHCTHCNLVYSFIFNHSHSSTKLTCSEETLYSFWDLARGFVRLGFVLESSWIDKRASGEIVSLKAIRNWELTENRPGSKEF